MHCLLTSIKMDAAVLVCKRIQKPMYGRLTGNPGFRNQNGNYNDPRFHDQFLGSLAPMEDCESSDFGPGMFQFDGCMFLEKTYRGLKMDTASYRICSNSISANVCI